MCDLKEKYTVVKNT